MKIQVIILERLQVGEPPSYETVGFMRCRVGCGHDVWLDEGAARLAANPLSGFTPCCRECLAAGESLRASGRPSAVEAEMNRNNPSVSGPELYRAMRAAVVMERLSKCGGMHGASARPSPACICWTEEGRFWVIIGRNFPLP